MNGLAALLALALVQSPEAQPAPVPSAPPEAPPPAAAQPPPDAQSPPAQFAPSAPATAPSPEAPSAPPTQETKPSPAAPVPAGTPRPRRSPSVPAPASNAKPPPGAESGAPDAGPVAPPSAAPAKEEKPSAERVQVAAAAAKFFQALLARRPGELVALCAPAFSFDGKVASGADPVRSAWADLVASRDGATYALLDLEVLSAADAQARYGKPPKRLAALAAPGAWVALANVSGRPTFVFFARQGNAWLATGMHD